MSRYGLIAFGSSLDQIGPLANSVEDAAMIPGVIAGRDENDSTSGHVEVDDYQSAISGDVRGLRVGVRASITAKASTRGEGENRSGDQEIVKGVARRL